MAMSWARDTDHAHFFASLPPGDLLPLEVGLRQVLIDWLHAKQGPFPLIEWIDRRIGAEVETRRDARGLFDICLRGAAMPPPAGAPAAGHRVPHPAHAGRQPPQRVASAAVPPPRQPPPQPAAVGKAAAAEAFFAGLPQDDFLAEEGDLRDAIFEFLATWEPLELASLQQMGAHPAVQRCRAAFLPRDVPLKDWIERRIGAELVMRKNAAGQTVVDVTPEARGFVKERHDRLLAERGGRADAAPLDTAAKAAAQEAKTAAKEAFFASLPADELLPGEADLRQAVLSFISGWRKGGSPTISDLAADAPTVQARTALMPSGVRLRTWIERRIGGEVELVKSPTGGDPLVVLRGAAPPVNEAPAAAKRTKHAAMEAKSGGGAAEAFFETLPEGEFTREEDDLRVALIDYLENAESPLLSDVSRAFMREPGLADFRSALLPQDVPFQMWLNRRLWNTVQIYKDPEGNLSLRLVGGDEPRVGLAAPDRPASRPGWKRGLEMEGFFDSLPTDSFTAGEEALRDAIIAFLGRQRGPKLPTLLAVYADPGVAKARKAALPKGADDVSMGAWIERRIGGEVDVQPGSDGHQAVQLREEAVDRKRRRT